MAGYWCAYRTTILSLSLPFSLLLLFVSKSSAEEPFTIEWKAGRLSVTAEGAPLAQVLREVARLTGVEVEGLKGLHEPVSARFANLPLREGLQRSGPKRLLHRRRSVSPGRPRARDDLGQQASAPWAGRRVPSAVAAAS
jgi:hypothetical protein